MYLEPTISYIIGKAALTIMSTDSPQCADPKLFSIYTDKLRIRGYTCDNILNSDLSLQNSNPDDKQNQISHLLKQHLLINDTMI